MNYKKLGKILGKIMVLESMLMLAPLAVALIYREEPRNVVAFLFPIILSAVLGFLMQIPKPERNTLYQKEGFALTALVWIVMTLIGAIPFVINGEIPNYVDACFEILTSLGCSPDECAYIGDSDVDARTGKNMGAHLNISALWGFRTKEELLSAGAESFATSPLEVIEIIKKEIC